jgi:hypothetical protein
LRCLDAGYFAVVSLAPFLPWIGISISFAGRSRAFLAGFAGKADAWRILLRRASHQVDYVLAARTRVNHDRLPRSANDERSAPVQTGQCRLSQGMEMQVEPD